MKTQIKCEISLFQVIDAETALMSFSGGIHHVIYRTLKKSGGVYARRLSEYGACAWVINRRWAIKYQDAFIFPTITAEFTWEHWLEGRDTTPATKPIAQTYEKSDFEVVTGLPKSTLDARKILGASFSDGKDALNKKWRALVKQHHTDTHAGTDDSELIRVNAAWNLLKQTYSAQWS